VTSISSTTVDLDALEPVIRDEGFSAWTLEGQKLVGIALIERVRQAEAETQIADEQVSARRRELAAAHRQAGAGEVGS
jgi:hypothetical protein